MSQLLRKPKRLNEQGFASVVIALVLIIVLALLTVGFAQLARHEQQNALSKQLAGQANYAAESGINDAYSDITHDPPYINTTTAPDPNQCLTSVTSPLASGSHSLPTAALTANQDVDAIHDISYTCLLVDLAPPDLSFGNVTPSSGQHATFSTSTPLNNLTVTWGSANSQNNFPPTIATKFPPQSAWHNVANHPYAPVIEFSITALPPNTNRDALINNTFTVYLYPASSGGTPCTVTGTSHPSCVVTTSGQGQIISGNCNNTPPSSYPCSVTLTAGVPGVYSNFLIHFRTFYSNSPANILITGADNSGAPVDFSGEPKIDVTGRAKNVLKRLQVRFLTNGTTGGADDTLVLPSSAIEAQNICKRLQTAPVSADNPLGTIFSPSGAPCDLEQHSP